MLPYTCSNGLCIISTQIFIQKRSLWVSGITSRYKFHTSRHANFAFPILELLTVGKRNYFIGYGILLHDLPVVAILFIKSNNNEGTMKNSVLHEIFCKSLFRTSRPIVNSSLSLHCYCFG